MDLKNKLYHINNCLEDLALISVIFKVDNVDHNSRILQFGYKLGRLIHLTMDIFPFYVSLIKYNLNRDLYFYSMSMAQKVILDSLPEEPSGIQLINYGFAIGFIQECFYHCSNTWWIPICNSAYESNWKAVAKRTITTLEKHRLPYVINSTDHISVFSGQIDWNHINEIIVRENEKMKKEIEDYFPKKNDNNRLSYPLL